MVFRPFHYFDTGCASYVFGCGTAGRGAVVDPLERDADAYLAFAASKELKITHVIDTHVHADHRSGGRAVAAKAGAAYCLHRAADVGFPFTSLDDGQVVELGNTVIRVLHTPGHTPESVCLLVSDLRRGPDPWFLLTGDTLFVGSVGRPDLRGRAREFAGQLHATLREKLLPLPGELEVYPGHFSGSACGAGLSGKPMTTLAFEKRWNPVLALERDEFVVQVTRDNPAEPEGMEEIIMYNRGRGT